MFGTLEIVSTCCNSTKLNPEVYVWPSADCFNIVFRERNWRNMLSNTFHKEAYRSSLKYFEKYKLKLNSKHFERSDKTDLFTIQLRNWLS